MDTQNIVNQIEIGMVAGAASIALSFLGYALKQAAGYLGHLHHSALALMMVRAFQDALPSKLGTPETLALRAFMNKTGKSDIDAVPYINDALQIIKTTSFVTSVSNIPSSDVAIKPAEITITPNINLGERGN